MPQLSARLFTTLRGLLLPLVALALLLAFNAIWTPGFFTLDVRDGRLYGTLIDILNHGSKVGILALGMTLVIATGGVDLSVGAVMAIAGAVAAQMVSAGHGPVPAMACASAVGLACGLWNGILVTLLKLQPIVATLILMVTGRGIAQLVTGGLIVTFDDPVLTSIGNASILGLPIPVTMLVVMLAILALGTRGTAIGLFLESVGESAPAARLAGVPVLAITLMAYAVCGLCASASGLIEASYIRAADANNAGVSLELDAILAVVIGGTALTGGRFSLIGSIVGAIFIQTLTKTLVMQDINTNIAPAPKAMVVLAVCLLYSPVTRERIRGFIQPRRRGGSTA